MSQRKVSRRIFLMGSAAVIGGCATGQRAAKRSFRYRSPNEKLNIAGIGVGGKGRSDMVGCAGENIVALCDVDWNRAAESFERFPKARRYKDFRKMLEKQKDIDAVVVTTPDHTHYVAAMTAMQLGKHVYVQKPLTHNVWEAQMLTEAAKKYKVATQMGNQGHCGEDIRRFCEMIWSGVIGHVREVHTWTNRPVWPQPVQLPLAPSRPPRYFDWDLWLGPAPLRPYGGPYIAGEQLGYAPFAWRGWWDFGTGSLGDMGCHIIDPCNWALKLAAPTSVEPVKQVGNCEQSGPAACVIKYEFPQRGELSPVAVYWYDGGYVPPRPEGMGPDIMLGKGRNSEQGRIIENGSLFIGDKGMIAAGQNGDDPRLFPEELHRDFTIPPRTIPRVIDNDPYKDWIQACKGGNPACSNFDYAGPFAEYVVLGNVALRTGKKILWDAEKMQVTNIPEANQYIRRNHRRGWDI